MNLPATAAISIGDADSMHAALQSAAVEWTVRIPLIAASALDVSDYQWEAAIVEPLLFAFQVVQAAMRSDRPPRELTFEITADHWVGLGEVAIEAIRCFCRSAAIEMAPRGITLHAICGGDLSSCEPLLRTAPSGTWIDLRQRTPIAIEATTQPFRERILQQIAIVTGAGSGIGKAIAQRLAQDGAAVVIVDRDSKTAAVVADEITQHRGRVATVAGDVADCATLEHAAQCAAGRWGCVTTWINNAGICRRCSIPELTTEEWRYAIAVNLKPAIVAAQVMTRSLGAAAIVNISSTAARSAGLVGSGRYNAYAPYCATKAGLDALTRVLARELGPKFVNVNAVAPGPVLTELSERLYSAEDRHAVERFVPFGRFAVPGEIAETVSFLVSPRARYITGQIITVDGGLMSTWLA